MQLLLYLVRIVTVAHAMLVMLVILMEPPDTLSQLDFSACT